MFNPTTLKSRLIRRAMLAVLFLIVMGSYCYMGYHDIPKAREMAEKLCTANFTLALGFAAMLIPFWQTLIRNKQRQHMKSFYPLLYELITFLCANIITLCLSLTTAPLWVTGLFFFIVVGVLLVLVDRTVVTLYAAMTDV